MYIFFHIYLEIRFYVVIFVADYLGLSTISKHIVMETKGRACYKFPTVEVSHVVLEGCIAASMILMAPDADNFNKYEWDIQAETVNPDFDFLF